MIWMDLRISTRHGKREKQLRLEPESPLLIDFRLGLAPLSIADKKFQQCSTPKPSPVDRTLSPTPPPCPHASQCRQRTPLPTPTSPSPPLHAGRCSPRTPSLTSSKSPLPPPTGCRRQKTPLRSTEYVERTPIKSEPNESSEHNDTRYLGRPLGAWSPTPTTQTKPRSIQDFLKSLEIERLSEAQLSLEHSIVLCNTRQALAEAIYQGRVSELDNEVALFIRSLRLLGVGVCREILEKGFLGHQLSTSAGHRD